MKNRKAATIFIPYEFIQAIYPDIDQIAFDCVSIDDKERKTQFEELRQNLNAIVGTYENKDNDPLAYIKVTSLSRQIFNPILEEPTC